MVVPYHHRLSGRTKTTCKKYVVQVHFKGGQTIKGLLMTPKDKDPITNKVESYTDINAMKMGVRKSVLENLQEPLQRGSKNTRSPPPQFMTILTPQVIKLPSTISL